MPGVNYYDGASWSEVAAVQQADGSTAPVYRWDGSQWVKIYPSGAPASVVAQYTGDTFTTGDSTWVDDAGGDEDLSITGDPQSDTLSDGSASVNFDGTDDVGTFTPPASLEGSDLISMAYEFAAQYTDTSVQIISGLNNDGENQALGFQLNRDEDFNNVAGQLVVTMQDLDKTALTFSPASNPGLDDGARHDVSIIINDSSTNDVEIIIDGSSVSLTFSEQQSPDNFSDWKHDWPVGANNSTGSLGSYADIGIGALRIHNDAISSQTIDSLP